MNSILNALKIYVRHAAILALVAFVAIGSLASNVSAADDAYRPPPDSVSGFGGRDAQGSPQPETYEPYPPPQTDSGPYRSLDGSRRDSGGRDYGGRDYGGRDSGVGYGEPYTAAPAETGRGEYYEQLPPGEGGPYEGKPRGYFTQQEILRAGHGFFGKVSGGLASAVEWAFQNAGRPNGYVLGQDAGGAFVAGLRYGEGKLYTKDAGTYKVYWQGPSLGYDAGAEGSKVMTLVYNLHDPSDIYKRFGGVEGSAYLVGGVSVQLQKAGHVTLAPIRAGVGLRLGANVGYLKYTRTPTWNPF